MVKVGTERRLQNRFLKVGFYILLISTAFLIGVLYPQFKGLNLKNIISEDSKYDGEIVSDKQENSKKLSDYWKIYTNEDYGISFSYPRLLKEDIYEDTGDYDYFVVFEENQYSLEKGIAFGVGSSGFENEIEKIKNEISSQENINIVKDEELFGLGEKAQLLEFDPKEADLEKRSFVIVEKGVYTYSLSTSPEQMQTLIDSIKFLD